MNIGFDASRITVSQRTGTENYSYYLAQAMARVDKDNRYTLYFRKEPSEKLVDELVGDKDSFSIKVISWPRLWTQGGLAWECVKNPPDILFVPAHTLPIIRHPSIYSVVTVHDLGFEYLPEYHQFPQKLYLDRMTRYAAASADHIIAVSSSTKKDLITKFGTEEERITVIHEGVDKQRFFPEEDTAKKVVEKYSLDFPYILFVGTVQPRKNLRRLIKAFSLLVTSKRNSLEKVGKASNLKLLLAGKPGWLYDDIYSAPTEFGVADRVKFLGHVPGEDLPGLYQQAICFCLPSLYEGFGLPVLESMASGTPVVLANVSSLPEVGGEAAIYVDPYSAESIAQGLFELLSLAGSSEYEKLVSDGFARVNKFTWEQCARRTLAVLALGGSD